MRNEDVTGINAEVDVMVDAVEVGVDEDAVVRAGRNELSGLFENMIVAMSSSWELHSADTERRKPVRSQPLIYASRGEDSDLIVQTVRKSE